MSEEGVASPDTGTAGGGAQDGGQVQSWLDQHLAGDEYADLRNSDSLKTVPDVPTLAKAFVDTKAMVGRKGVIVPKDDAPPEEWDQFYAALGRPESPEAYDIKPEGLPENFPYLPELESVYRKLAHEAGLTPAAAKKIYDGYNQFMLEEYRKGQQTLKAEMEEIQAGLQKEWGGKYDENLILAKRAMGRVAPPGSPELAALDKAIGESPVLVKFFYNLGKSMSEGDFIAGGGVQNSSLEARRQELMRHPAYLDVKHAEHQHVVEEVSRIYQEMHPQKQGDNG
jgi:hypothetical protein